MARPLAADAVETLTAALAGLAGRYGWRLVVLFGSAVGGGPARDLDLGLVALADRVSAALRRSLG